MNYAYPIAAKPEPATVLVVDDEVLGRIVLADELRETGYDVLEAASADEALQVLASGVTVDLLVTDIRMPGSMDGAGLARLVHVKLPDIRIIVVSAEPPFVGLTAFVDDYFEKPYDVARVRERATALLRPERSIRSLCATA